LDGHGDAASSEHTGRTYWRSARRPVSIALSVVADAGWLAVGGGDARTRTERACPPRPPVTTHRIVSRADSRAVVTEYYPVRDAWFSATLARLAWLAAIVMTGCTVRTASR
jgi:hypothetical protein